MNTFLGVSAVELEQVAGWIAAAATIIAAVMTASNLGPRITGWGFAVFSVGSVAWVVTALTSGQASLLLTNGLLLAINLIGVWRWLGREARYRDGGEAAARQSRARRVPTLIPMGSLAGMKVADRADEPIGTVVDAMMRCEDTRLAYVVISDGALAGISETLRAVAPEDLRFQDGEIGTLLSAAEFQGLPALDRDAWPEQVPAPTDRAAKATGAPGPSRSP